MDAIAPAAGDACDSGAEVGGGGGGGGEDVSRLSLPTSAVDGNSVDMRAAVHRERESMSHRAPSRKRRALSHSH